MYCPACGTALTLGARYCQACGHDISNKNTVSTSKKSQVTEKPRKIVKPVLISWVILAKYLPLQINLSLTAAAFAGAGAFLISLFTKDAPDIVNTMIIFGILFFIGVPASIYYIARKTYDKTDYRFYREHLEYAEGFWTVEKKSVRYGAITDITMRKGVIQRLYGVGTIYISVPSLGPRIRGFSGVTIADVRDPERIYQEIQLTVAAG